MRWGHGHGASREGHRWRHGHGPCRESMRRRHGHGASRESNCRRHRHGSSRESMHRGHRHRSRRESMRRGHRHRASRESMRRGHRHRASWKGIRCAGRNNKKPKEKDFKNIQRARTHGKLSWRRQSALNLAKKEYPNRVMQSTTKVVFEIIFHLSNGLPTTMVIKNCITNSLFVFHSPEKMGLRRAVGPIFGTEGPRSVIQKQKWDLQTRRF